jgi:hypothetical protein
MRDKSLPGKIMRWNLVYGVLPSPESWMWSYYPDGLLWKMGLEEYGDEVFAALTSKYWPNTTSVE